MKKIGSMLTLFGLFVSLYSIGHQLKTVTPLSEIIETMNEANVTIEKWELIAKEEEANVFDRNGYEAYVGKIQHQLKHFQWNEPAVFDDVIHITGTKHSHDGKITEKVVIATQLNDDVYETKLIYKMTGADWKAAETNDVFSLFSTRTYGLFSKSPSFYTCVTGKKSDTMRSALSVEAKRIMKQLGGKFVESLEEPSFVSLSAYNKQWEPSITTNGKKMNVQIALRNESSTNSTHVLIGTPILLDEY